MRVLIAEDDPVFGRVLEASLVKWGHDVIAVSQVKQLQGLLPICSYCKKIRDDQNYWQQVEDYVSEHSEVQFTHSICPKCYEKTVKPMLAEYREPRQGKS